MSKFTDLELKILSADRDYRMGRPNYTDKEYDEMLEALPANSILKSNGIISKVPSERKEDLPIQMFSMDKVKSIDEIKKWLVSLNLPDSLTLILTPKYDGISLLADESLGLAWTRGDGYIGQTSHEHFSVLEKGNELHADIRSLTWGEAIMPKKLFAKYSDKYANPRNMVAGLFNTAEIRKELSDVFFMRYGCMDSKDDHYSTISSLNLSNPLPVLTGSISLGDLLKSSNSDISEFFDDMYNLAYKDFEIDGIILEINDRDFRNSLGRESNNNPAYARAVKLEQWQKGDTVKVLGINWEISKQGALKPVISVVPTQVGGVIISNVTGYNARYVEENQIDAGAVIEIIRSGDVIPKHIKTVIEPKTFKLPKFCPSCSSETIWDENEVELMCLFDGCTEKRIKKIMYFFEKAGFENFGEGKVRDLFSNGYHSIKSILEIDTSKLATMSSWGSTSANNLSIQIKSLLEKGMPFAELLQAFDLFDGKIGSKTAQLILDNVEPKDYYDLEVLRRVEGVGNLYAQSFIDACLKYDVLDCPVPVSFWKAPKKEQTGTSFSDWNVCFSGCRNKDLQDKIESEGGSICSGVSNKTTHLIVKDLSDKVLSSSKSKKAKELGVTILAITDLI